jgi:hypothetical protein
VKNLLAAALFVLFVLTVGSCGTGNHLVSVAVSPNPASINAPGSLQLQAIGTFSDGTTLGLPTATWTYATTTDVIKVSNTGLATCGVQGGPASEPATVTASFAGLSGSTKLACYSPLV